MNSDKNQFSFTEVEHTGPTCRFAAVGHVNIANSAQMERALERCLTEGCTKITVDMYKVTFLSSAGIRVILNIFKKAKKLGGRLQIVSPSENVRNVIGTTALDELLF